MTRLSNLPKDLLEEILSRVPVKSMGVVRSICRNWYILSKDESFTKKHLAQEAASRERELQVVMMINFKVYLLSINLNGINKEENTELHIKYKGKLNSLIDVSLVYHCDGLLLCFTKDFIRLVVWNPYWGQTRWIQPRTRRNDGMNWLAYAFGYETKNSRRSYKILSFVDYTLGNKHVEYEMYDLDSQYWRALDFTSDRDIDFDRNGVSVKGNTYWYSYQEGEMVEFLICFDFTKERFGPNLPLPFQSHGGDILTLFSVREEQLAVLFQRWDILKMEIWITNEIDPNAVSWGKLFLAVDVNPLFHFSFSVKDGSIFIDEEKKVVVIFGKRREDQSQTSKTYNTAYIFGEDGRFRQGDFGESAHNLCLPVGCSYSPGLVQVKQHY